MQLHVTYGSLLFLNALRHVNTIAAVLPATPEISSLMLDLRPQDEDGLIMEVTSAYSKEDRRLRLKIADAIGGGYTGWLELSCETTGRDEEPETYEEKFTCSAAGSGPEVAERFGHAVANRLYAFFRSGELPTDRLQVLFT